MPSLIQLMFYYHNKSFNTQLLRQKRFLAYTIQSKHLRNQLIYFMFHCLYDISISCRYNPKYFQRVRQNLTPQHNVSNQNQLNGRRMDSVYKRKLSYLAVEAKKKKAFQSSRDYFMYIIVTISI